MKSGVPRTCPVGGELQVVELGDSEVGELGATLASDEDVGRFDVAVDEPLSVGGVQSTGYLANDIDGLCRR